MTDTSNEINMRLFLSRFAQFRQPREAVKIQEWWRRMLEIRAAKKPLRTIFEGDVTGLTGLRCLVLIGAHDDVLGRWARAIIQLGPEPILDRVLGKQSTSWLVLLRKAALLLVLSLHYAPESPNTSLYLEVLTIFLSNEHSVATSGAQGTAFCQAITAYLMKKQFYGLLRKLIPKLPIQSSTSLQPYLTLCVLPLSIYSEDSPEFSKIYVDIFVHILSLPLLPNRLPPDSPSPFISYFLLTKLEKLADVISSINKNLNRCSPPDLAANLFMFVSPHYERLSPTAFASYLQLSVMLINRFNVYSWHSSSAMEPRSNVKSQTNHVDHDSDFSDGSSDYEDSQLDEDDWPFSFMRVNAESIKWISKAAARPHITNLLKFTPLQAILLPHLAAYLFVVTATWPSSQQEVYNIVLASSNGQLVGDLYREVVRQSPLGQEEDSKNVYRSGSAIHWPPIILLADLYCQALQTMDDEEFYGKTPGSHGRNPLTLEEVASFSVQLRNIIFSLYWRYSHDNPDFDEPDWNQIYVHVSPHVYCSWKALREKLLRCLLRIHARNCRRPFVRLGHWLIRSQLDMNSFIDAAITKEQRYSETHYSQPPRIITSQHWNSLLPYLSLLKNIPFAIPFEVRVSIFQHFIVNDRLSHGSTEQLNALGHHQRPGVKIRRGAVFLDGFAGLAEVDLKTPLEIVMTDNFGQEEDWIDGEGHFKEFFMSFCQRVFGTNLGLWVKNKWGGFYPTSYRYATQDHVLDWYWFVGCMIGKAMYDGILMEIGFAYFFLSKWLGRRSYFDDLFSLDPDLYHRLLSLKHSTENIEDLSLRFAIVTQESGVTRTVDLMPNGHEIAVTRENRLRYIDLCARYHLNAQIKRQSEAFLQGLSQLIQPKWLKMFDQRELQILIGGTVAPIDLDDLRCHTTYGGVYHNDHETIIAFWRVVNSFHRWQKHSLLRSVTSCSRPHVLGFKELVPNFSIRDDGSDENRLPTSRRCINLLKLPMYKSDRQLREMLLEAITSRAGFDSS